MLVHKRRHIVYNVQNHDVKGVNRRHKCCETPRGVIRGRRESGVPQCSSSARTRSSSFVPVGEVTVATAQLRGPIYGMYRTNLGQGPDPHLVGSNDHLDGAPR